MLLSFVVRPLALASLLVLPLGSCVAGPANPSASRAVVLANTVSRAIVCRAGNPRAGMLERFLAAEKARGATPEQIASARAAYVTVSEADMINQGIQPKPGERDELRARMGQIRAGSFDAL